jgi:hypothetical protein
LFSRGPARVQGVRAWAIVGPQIGPRFPRHKPPRGVDTPIFRKSVLGRVFAPDGVPGNTISGIVKTHGVDRRDSQRDGRR